MSAHSDGPIRHSEVSAASLGRAARRLASPFAFGVVPVAVLTVVLVLSVGDQFAFDFRQFWQAGNDVVHARSPYPETVPAAAPAALSPEAIQEVFRFPYPAPAALVMAPFGLLPFGVAAAIFTVLLVLSVPTTLLVLGVRDWRCHGVALGSIAVVSAIRLGTFTPLLALALAIAWRYRDRRWLTAAALAGAIVAKVFLWPLVVWLVATRRFATALATFALAAGSTLLAWAVLGFAGFEEYPSLVRTLADAVQAKGYSLVALGVGIGFADDVARAASLLVGAGILATVFGLSRRRDDGDQRSFAAALGAALAFAPIVWLHYFALLFVPIAIARPRLTPLWFVPLALWATPYPESGGDVWRIALGVFVASVALTAPYVVALRAARSRSVAVAG